MDLEALGDFEEKMAVIRTADESVVEFMAEVIVVPAFTDLSPEGHAAKIDEATEGTLTWLYESQEITGKQGELVPIHRPKPLATSLVLVIGFGDRSKLDRGTVFRGVATATKYLAGRQRGRVAFFLDEEWSDDWVEAALCAIQVGTMGQDLYRLEKKRHPFSEVVWNGSSQQAVEQGSILGESVNLTRELVNEPPSAIYPETFAERATTEAGDCGFEIEVWDEERLKKERCLSLLGVGQGSSRPSRLVIMRHNGGGSEAPIALVGKGVTFDSGGLSLKPSDGMKTMKCDMAGAATVLGAMCAIARLKLPVNVVGLVGLAENMISGDCYRLGDVLETRLGKTVEVLNTDAEGRLVLADVLDVAVEQKPAHIIDLATLTGACVVALGLDVAGLMTNDQEWCDKIAAAADVCGEPVWQLPMFDDFSEQIRSEVADIKNIGEGRWGGAITAAKFLEEFVGETSWTHIDIAGPAFLDKPKDWVDGGGSGVMVRTLVELIRSLGK